MLGTVGGVIAVWLGGKRGALLAVRTPARTLGYSLAVARLCRSSLQAQPRSGHWVASMGTGR